MDAANFFLQSAAVAALSLTITTSKIFKPLRDNLTGWKKTLFTCPYCFSHWTAWMVGAFTDNPHITRSRWVDFAVYWFALVAASAVISGVIMKLWLWQETKIAELESELSVATELIKDLTGQEK